MQTDPLIDAYIRKLKNWKQEVVLLRKIVLACGLTEVCKWKHPCYTWKDKNILMLGDFKQHCSIMFFNGAALTDPNTLLEKGGEHTQSGRIFKFTSVAAIKKYKKTIEAFIKEAIQLQKDNKLPIKKAAPTIPYPPELKTAFKQHPAFQNAFEKLTPGRQRDYLILFTGSASSETRLGRIERNKQRIMDGFGRNDCTCGLSKRMPQCDGSHKSLRK
jgi:uncharacterized protein YdeI (YjbR/CyaY-like superfamily)